MFVRLWPLLALSLPLVSSCVRTPQDMERDYARTLKPAALKAVPSSGAEPVKARILTVRAYADADYRMQGIRWADRFIETLQAASAVLEPQLGVTFKLVDSGSWERNRVGTDLQTALAELTARDPGHDVDLVIGLVGGLNTTSASHEQLGMARPFGQHAVLRNTESADESLQLQEMFKHLPAQEREALYLERKQHRTVSVLIHEWAHTMGAFHPQDPRWLMAPNYLPSQSEFARQTRELLATVLRHHPQSRRSRSAQIALARELRPLVETMTGPDWESADRDLLRSWIELAERGEAPLRLASTVLPQDLPAVRAAMALYNEGRLELATMRLSPLVDRYPEEELVQVLACALEVRMERQAEAMDRCTVASRKFPDNPTPLLATASLQLEAKQWAEATTSLTEARARLQRPTAETRHWLHFAEVARGAGLVTWADEAAARAPVGAASDEIRSWATRARRWLALGDGSRPSGVSPDREGELYREQEGIAQALDRRDRTGASRLRALEKAFPQAVLVQVLTCASHLTAGRAAKGRAACEAALKAEPEAVQAHYLLAMDALGTRKTEAAVARLTRVIELDDRHMGAWSMLSEVFRRERKSGDLEKLRQDYRTRFSAELP